MKSIRKTLSIILLLAFVSTPILAQSQQRGDRNRDRSDRLRDVPTEVRTEAHIAVFDAYLSLTDEQKTALARIDQEFAIKREALRSEPVNRQRKMVMSRDLQSEHQQAIHDVLTKEQYSVFLEKREAIQVEVRQRLRAYSNKEG